MTHKELIVFVREIVPECDCKHAGDHVYKLAVAVLERQKADDAAIAAQYSAEAAEAINATR